MRELRDRVAVVTGGASGIGRGMAEAFLREGMKVVVADVEEAALEKTCGELESHGEVRGVRCDVSDPAAVEALAAQTLEAFGAVHVLCNNAGVGGGAGLPIWEAPLDEWDWVMGVNLNGVVHGLRSFVPLMLEHGDEAHVVNTASMAGLITAGGIYGVSKHAVVALSEGLHRDLVARDAARVGVSVLCPGWVNTRILESERNRPEAPRPAPSEAGPMAAMRAAVEGLIKGGLDPQEVGRIVVDAIRASRFYVFTHPWQAMVERRMQNILEDRAPDPLPPPGLLGGDSD